MGFRWIQVNFAENSVHISMSLPLISIKSGLLDFDSSSSHFSSNVFKVSSWRWSSESCFTRSCFSFSARLFSASPIIFLKTLIIQLLANLVSNVRRAHNWWSVLMFFSCSLLASCSCSSVFLAICNSTSNWRCCCLRALTLLSTFALCILYITSMLSNVCSSVWNGVKSLFSCDRSLTTSGVTVDIFVFVWSKIAHSRHMLALQSRQNKLIFSSECPIFVHLGSCGFTGDHISGGRRGPEFSQWHWTILL